MLSRMTEEEAIKIVEVEERHRHYFLDPEDEDVKEYLNLWYDESEKVNILVYGDIGWCLVIDNHNGFRGVKSMLGYQAYTMDCDELVTARRIYWEKQVLELYIECMLNGEIECAKELKEFYDTQIEWYYTRFYDWKTGKFVGEHEDNSVKRS